MANLIEFWRLIHQAYAGEMPECLGTGCTNTCCGVKVVNVPDSGAGCGKELRYRTSTRPGEVELLRRAAPRLIEITPVKMDDGERFYIRGCLEEGVGCRLGPLRPWGCKSYPFNLTDVTSPIDIEGCPAAREIGSNQETVIALLRIRKAMGFEDGKQWLTRLLAVVRQ